MERTELQKVFLEAQRGDRGSFKVLYDILSPRLFRFIRPRSKNRADALDVLQETFIDFWKGLSRFSYQGDASLEALLYKIAQRKIAKGFRFWKKVISLEAIDDVIIDPASEQEEGITLDVVYALALLSEKERTLVTLRHIEGNSFSEIAQLLGESENALKVRHHRALARLRKKLSHA